MFCGDCGARNTEVAKSCVSCGHLLQLARPASDQWWDESEASESEAKHPPPPMPVFDVPALAPDFADDVSQPRPRRKLLIGALAAWTLGIACLGAFGGFQIFNRYAVHAAPSIEFATAAANSGPDASKGAAGSSIVTVPDVRGLSQAGAMEAFADAGIDPTSVEINKQTYAIPAGEVVSQSPLGGTSSPGAVTITIATAAKMPQLVGSSAEAATAKLETFGVRPREIQIYAPSVPLGNVVKTSPGAGGNLIQDATIEVSSAAASLFLTDLHPDSGGCSTGSATVVGTTYDQSLLCTPGSEVQIVDYAIGGHADGLKMTFGVSDGAATGSTAKVQLFGDGKLLSTADVIYGKTKDVLLDLHGVIKLSIQISAAGDATGVLGDIRLLGSAQGMDQISASQAP